MEITNLGHPEWGEFELLNGDILDKEYVLNIYCITYNHAAYLKQTFDQFLAQRLTYSYYIFVYDDASNDGTTDIVRDYANRFPDKFLCLIAHQNTYGKSFRNLLNDEIKRRFWIGKYVAVCEGDDFWIDNNKLQIQLDFMLNNPGYSLTGHNTLIGSEIDGGVVALDGFDREQDVTMEEVIVHKKYCMHTSSVVVRRDAIPMIDFLGDCAFGDWPWLLYARSKGEMHYFDRIMSYYRHGHDGSWTSGVKSTTASMMKHSINWCKFMTRFDEFMLRQYHELIQKQIDTVYLKRVVVKEPEISYERFAQICDEVGSIENGSSEYIKKLLELKREQLRAEIEFAEFINKYNHILIMGTGVFSRKLTIRLVDANIDFDGYTVSNNQMVTGGQLGKMIWKMKDIPFDKDEVGILIAIKRNVQQEVEKSLSENGLNNYMWIDM